MKRTTAAIAVVLATTVLSLGIGSRGSAQDATPAGGAAPIVSEVLGTGMPSDGAGKQLLLLRVTIQPGGVIPSHVHPGALVIAVESGDFGFTVLQGEADVTRAAVNGTPSPVEKLTPGTEVVVHAGDEVFEQAGVIHTARNAGDTPVVVLVAGLVDPTQPFLQPMAMGTPTS